MIFVRRSVRTLDVVDLVQDGVIRSGRSLRVYPERRGGRTTATEACGAEAAASGAEGTKALCVYVYELVHA